MASAKRETVASAPNASAKGEAVPGIDTSSWANEQVGFDPYWVPEIGKKIIGTLLMRDDRDLGFIRYQFIAAQSTDCQRGPASDENPRHEEVTVPAGETFNISKYASLEPVLNEYLLYSSDTGLGVMVALEITGWVPTKNQPKCWTWKASVPPQVKAQLNEWRISHKAKLIPAVPAREQLQA